MKPKWQRFWKEWIKPVLVILIITSAFRSAMADWNDVPTGSMKPTIMEGDRIFINKLAYDLKIPFTTIHVAQWADPRRGDIIVLFSPADNRRLVKRVVGLPGDWIEIQNDELRINGKLISYEPLDQNIANEIPASEQPYHAFLAEDLSGKQHPVMMTPLNSTVRDFGPYQVPSAKYFVMGDNRDNSFDSRYFGPVDRSRILGQAVAVVASVNPENHYLPRWHRFFTRLP
ncbi:MAG: signal peptidase I [Acidobacteria bacterium]|nr:MAG: signal peptidase I [Acidobacteriota bacterium]